MVVSKVVNKNIIAYDLYLDITRNTLLYDLCKELKLKTLFIDVYSVRENNKEFVDNLLKTGTHAVYIPYKDGFEDWAIKLDTDHISSFLMILGQCSFDEITVWSGNQSWEQYLFLKSARRKINVEDKSDLYLCYNCSENMVELYLIPTVNIQVIEQIIAKYLE